MPGPSPCSWKSFESSRYGLFGVDIIYCDNCISLIGLFLFYEGDQCGAQQRLCAGNSMCFWGFHRFPLCFSFEWLVAVRFPLCFCFVSVTNIWWRSGFGRLQPVADGLFLFLLQFWQLDMLPKSNSSIGSSGSVAARPRGAALPTPRKRGAPWSSCHRTTTSYAAHSDTFREKQLRQKIKLRIISEGAQIRSVLLVHDDIILVNCAMYGNWVIPHQSQALGIIRMLKQSRLVSELCGEFSNGFKRHEWFEERRIKFFRETISWVDVYFVWTMVSY